MYLKNLISMTLELPPLSFQKSDLSPFINEETITFHYEKHHYGYIKKSLILLNETDGSKVYLVPLIQELQKKPHPNLILLFNLQQVLNHNLFWMCLQNKPVTVEEKIFISKYFNSYEEFCHEFVQKGLNHMGSGWIWLLSDNNKIWITTSDNAHIPQEVLDGVKIITICDLWEHSYYLNYKNNRQLYLENFLQYLMILHFNDI
jgi:superoxide dismutase, Fe-Mn family